MQIRSYRSRSAHPIRALVISLCILGLIHRADAVEYQEPAPSSSERVIPLSVNGKPATEGVIWSGEQLFDHPDIAQSKMLRDLANIAGHLDARALATLRRSIGDPLDLDSETALIATFRLLRGGDSIDHQIVRIESGQIVLLDQGDTTRGRLLDPEHFIASGVEMSVLDGIPKRDLREPIRADLAKYESPVLLEPKLRKVRFKHTYPQLTRELDREQYRIRLPNGVHTESLPGVLVWISPTPNGQIPGMFFKACDELNLIAVGVDNNGNTRELTDRLQNHFDSLATVAAHYQIDDRRVYVTGMSGGGRCSSILQLAFPDVFMGAVPIVGLDSYHQTPTGDPGMFWPARLGRPDLRWFKLLADRRIAAITGTMDFNAPEMRKRSKQMNDDRIVIRLDMIEGMGHTMPSPDQFLDALAWVDELQRERIAQQEEQAMQLLERIKTQHERRKTEQGLGEHAGTRKQLIQITIDAPWSPAAREAAEILGIEH